MRYVKCDNDNCQADISGKPHFLLLKVTETKGKHRNPKRQTIIRLCDKCAHRIKIKTDEETIGRGKPLHLWEKDYKEQILNEKKHSYGKIIIRSYWDVWDGDLVEIMDTTIYKTKTRLLFDKLQGLKEALTGFKPFRIQMDYKQTLQEATDLKRIQDTLGEYIRYLGFYVPSYKLSEDLSVYYKIDDDYRLEQKEKVVSDVKKWKKNYFNKIDFDSNPDFKEVILKMLISLHTVIANNMIKQGIFIKNDDVVNVEKKEKPLILNEK